MTEPTPAERLRSNAERILDRTSVRERDREDLAEELYGHLWQRWQDGIVAGLTGDEAADAAISGFGDADRLGREMTSAYHSRLYASTIGVLLPAVAGSSDKPYGYGRSRALVFLTGLFTLVGGAIVANGQTPFRLLVSVLALLLAFFITVLAYRALARRQRWALVYVQVLALAFVAGWIAECVAQPVQVSLLGIVALVVLDAVFRNDLSLWVSSSRGTGKLLGAVIVVSVLLPYVPLAVGAVPDPTQASPADLSITVRADCTRTGAAVTGGTITTTLVWTRTDFLPNGFRSNMARTDLIGASSASSLQFDPDPNGQSFPSALEDGVVVTGNWAVVDAETGLTADAGVLMYSGGLTVITDVGASTFSGSSFDVGVIKDGIDPGSIHANRTYRASLGFISQQPTGLPDDPIFRIRYDHQGRWGMEAFATCTQSGVGQPVTPPVQAANRIP